jgi:hypothetical protein
MQKIVLISCVKEKAAVRCKAERLYQSDLFAKSLAYARCRCPDQILILSAKHGLVRLDDEIQPYDETLKSMPVSDVRRWADRVLGQLRGVCDLKADEFIVLASDRYRRFLLPHLRHHQIPMKGLRIGEQLRFLKNHAGSPMSGKHQIDEVLAAIAKITEGIDRLKSLGVVRSRKTYADLAEWLVREAFGGSLAACKNQPDWDVACDDGRVQVRSHSKAVENPNRWSSTKGTYDWLVIVVFNESLRIAELYRVPASDVQKVKKPKETVAWDDVQQWRVRAEDVPSHLKPFFEQS